jgi:hypothetical protein
MLLPGRAGGRSFDFRGRLGQGCTRAGDRLSAKSSQKPSAGGVLLDKAYPSRTEVANLAAQDALPAAEIAQPQSDAYGRLGPECTTRAGVNNRWQCRWVHRPSLGRLGYFEARLQLGCQGEEWLPTEILLAKVYYNSDDRGLDFTTGPTGFRLQ